MNWPVKAKNVSMTMAGWLLIRDWNEGQRLLGSVTKNR